MLDGVAGHRGYQDEQQGQPHGCRRANRQTRSEVEERRAIGRNAARIGEQASEHGAEVMGCALGEKEEAERSSAEDEPRVELVALCDIAPLQRLVELLLGRI